MEDALARAAESVPNLIVMLAMIIMFLRHLAKRDETLSVLGDECHRVQRESNETMRQVTAAMGRVSKALDRVEVKNGTKT